jgi:hypothetical protein
VQLENLILRNAANGGVSRRMLQKSSVHLPSVLWSALLGRFAAPQGEVLARTRAVEMFHVKQMDARDEI